MKTLYIIGNGFDLHHGLKTSYKDFGEYLKYKNETLYKLLETYIDFPESDNDLWCRFEENLANLDTEAIISMFPEQIRNVTYSEFLSDMISDLIADFKKFILSIDVLNVNPTLLPLAEDAVYLNFNYTSTLESLYDIDLKNILYIHKKAEINNDKLIFGHALDPEDSRDKKWCPSGLSTIEEKKWLENTYRWEFSCDPEREATLQYLSRSFKSTTKIIEQNLSFFNGLGEVEEVFVLGHSLSSVDLPYFEKIANSVRIEANWRVSFFEDDSRDTFRETLNSIGINNNLEIKRIEELFYI